MKLLSLDLKKIEKVRHRFGIQQVIWIGDRGMITNTRILAEFQPVDGLDWITAQRASQIRKLVEQEAVQLSLFDETDLGGVLKGKSIVRRGTA